MALHTRLELHARAAHDKALRVERCRQRDGVHYAALGGAQSAALDHEASVFLYCSLSKISAADQLARVDPYDWYKWSARSERRCTAR